MAVIILSGPTGAGKSAIAHQIAMKHNAVIVSADAMTVYKQMDVATAKPSLLEQQQVNYYGIDLVQPDEEFSVFEFTELVDKACARHQSVLIAGGTPFYLRALLHPHAPMPSADPSIREQLSQEDNLHQKLIKVDPVLASRLHPNDKRRIIRGLEVYQLTGRPLSEVQKDKPNRKPLNCQVVWLEREDLRPRLMTRIIQMTENGYLKETQMLLSKGFNGSHKPMSSFSYVHMIDFIEKRISWLECLDKIEKGTWHLARKQRTWGRNMGFAASHAEEAYTLLDEFFGSKNA